ncbi:MAG TPA: bleomycin resistance protein [Lentisphaeria bacterium]|nr:bleomycin resistance protein [Lentisphaeria bacterium]
MSTQKKDPGLTGIHHNSVVTSDANRAREFYAGILGMKEIPYPSTFDFPVIWFELGDQQVHLVVANRPDAISPRHIAFHVRNASAAREALTAMGVAIEDTVKIPGAERFFVHDPDGNRIELIEWQIPWGDGPM